MRLFISPEIAGKPRHIATMRMYIYRVTSSEIEIFSFCMPRNQFIDAIFPSNGIMLSDPETRKG